MPIGGCCFVPMYTMYVLQCVLVPHYSFASIYLLFMELDGTDID
jgi:hypothetical protein